MQKLDDYHGLHPRMNELKRLYDEKRLAIIQGVGYPNPDRSHFESMDIWQLGDPTRAHGSGWLARSIPGMTVKDAGVPGMYIGNERLPVAMQGADGGVISLADRSSFRLQLSGNGDTRKKLIEDLNSEKDATKADLAAFVRKRQLQTYTSLQKIEEALRGSRNQRTRGASFRRPVRPPRPERPQFPERQAEPHRAADSEEPRHPALLRADRRVRHALRAGRHAREKLLGDLSNSIGNFFQRALGRALAKAWP